nr:hypothetical protein [Tanacetum cinerariifolium]
MAIPEDHLAKFHKITDAKEMWEAIKSRFSRNDESKKMKKYILKQQFESFSVSNSEGLHKGYDKFQSLLSQLETHDVGVSTEDANQRFLRSLPSSLSQVSLIMRTKPGVDTLSFDDLYNNLRVFESDVKGSTESSSSIHNVAFVSSNSTSSTNEVNTAYGVFTSSGHNSQREGSSSYTDQLMYSFFANQFSGLKLYHKDLKRLDEFNLEEMDLKWQKGEYDIWATKIEYYLEHTDYPIWEVIQKGIGHVQVSTDTLGQIRVLPPKTAKEILARERERKARTTLLMAIPEDHLAKFHKITDAKEMWEAIKSHYENKQVHIDNSEPALVHYENKQ